MSGIQLNTITAAGNAAANRVASALVPKTATATSGSQFKANATNGTTPTTPTSTTATATGTQNISSSDFLTLLVSELKNQDPTQPTDPNAYITQLAQVNSLQQLISINSGISTLDGAVAPAATTTANGTITTTAPALEVTGVTSTSAPAPASGS